MREAALGHWNYYTWHLPAAILMLCAVALAVVMGRSLRRNALGHRDRALRWRILGWSSITASMTSAIVWPYLGAAASVTVDGRGTWHVCNYLGVPLAELPAGEVRALRGVDLGGLGLGVGHLEIRRADGSVIRSVRLSRETLDAARRALGYPSSMVQSACGDLVIAPHRYAAMGPLAQR
jgi:hypothetical protein